MWALWRVPVNAGGFGGELGGSKWSRLPVEIGGRLAARELVKGEAAADALR